MRLDWNQLRQGLLSGIAVLALAAGCTITEKIVPEGQTSQDIGPEGLYADFLDGKFDGMGHPLGALVFQAELDCAPGTGELRAEGWGVEPGRDEPGVVCQNTAGPLGRGRHAINVRALLERALLEPSEVLLLTVQDGDGYELASRVFTSEDLGEPLTYQNLSVEFTMNTPGDVSFALQWSGTAAVRVDYLEVFLAMRRLVLSPASGVLAPQETFEVEVRNPPEESTVTMYCNGADLSTRFAQLVLSGDATDTGTEFRRVLTAPADLLLDECAPPRQVLVRLQAGWEQEWREVIYLADPPPCTFEPNTARVLLTAFGPFPPNPVDRPEAKVNSSQYAVMHFDATPLLEAPDLPAVSVMRLLLPVEFDAAPDWVADVVTRCEPDVVISFGQGRWLVDLETTAYNRKDTSVVPGGVPDNRGLVYVGEAIEEGGPDEVTTRLPVADILAGLEAAAINVRESTDPGRYVCNNVFYGTMRAIPPETIAGFVHLPRLYRIEAAEAAMLQTVVETAVHHSVLIWSAP